MIPIHFGGGLVLLQPDGNRLEILNSGAAAVWTLVEAGFSRTQAAEAIADHASLPFEQAMEHVEAIRGLWNSPPPSHSEPSDVSISLRHSSDAGEGKLYSINGTGFAFSSDDDDPRVRVEHALADCLDPNAEPRFELHIASGQGGEMQLLVDGRCRLESSETGEMAGAVFQAILEGVHADVDWLGLMHGAALANDGRAILLPGTSGVGKSTLAAFLTARGFTYLSDDLIALDAQGRVLPWSTPFSIKRGSWPILGDFYPELDELAETEVLKRRVKFVPVGRRPWTTPPAPVRLIVFPAFMPEQAASAQPIEALDALARLADERLWLGNPMTEAGVRRFLMWLEAVPAYQIIYPDLDTAERQIREIMVQLESPA